MKKVSFVIPCYRSEHTLPHVVAEIEEKMTSLEEQYNYDVYLVNDCSPDDTFEIIRKLCQEHQNIKAISFAKNFGQHSALMAGLRYSDGDYVVQDLNNRETSYIDPSDEVIEKVKDIQTRRVHDDNVALEDIRVQHPRLIQNSAYFPRCIGADENTGIYKYDYYMDYDSSEMPTMFYGTTGLGNKHRILTENSQ